MKIIAPARLAVAWLTMFLVGTELFVFSPLLPVLAADYHVTHAIGGTVGDGVFVWPIWWALRCSGIFRTGSDAGGF